MKKFILGISIFFYGAIGSLITYVYTLLNPIIYNDQEGWIINFIENNTAIPFIIFIIVMIVGIVICVNEFED